LRIVTQHLPQDLKIDTFIQNRQKSQLFRKFKLVRFTDTSKNSSSTCNIIKYTSVTKYPSIVHVQYRYVLPTAVYNITILQRQITIASLSYNYCLHVHTATQSISHKSGHHTTTRLTAVGPYSLQVNKGAIQSCQTISTVKLKSTLQGESNVISLSRSPPNLNIIFDGIARYWNTRNNPGLVF